MAEWVYVLRPPRQSFVDDMTDEESAVMREHFGYLKQLLADGKLILAGPSLGPVFGLAVFEAGDEAEARRIMAGDPAVSSGVQSAELSPFRVSLLRGCD